MRKIVFVWVFIVTTLVVVNAQVVINEGSNRNFNQLLDEDGDNPDWIELFNKSDQMVNLNGWFLSDNIDMPAKWEFPNFKIEPGAFRLIYLSGKNRRGEINHWESAVLSTDTFTYKIASVDIPSTWNTLDYTPENWSKGKGGFGFGDNDDNTLIPEGTMAVYVLRKFDIPDTSIIVEALAYVDYDDGFVAYLNGVEICRANISGTPSWNSGTNDSHEAQGYQGGNPDKFKLDMNVLKSCMREGENVFAVEIHNNSVNSQDMTLIPNLFFGIKNDSTYFSALPAWFTSGTVLSVHANFKITTKGETIYLFNSSKELVDSLRVGNLITNNSIGRVKDGAPETGIYTQATPGATNNIYTPNTSGYEPLPEFSVSSGFYTSAIKVSITSPSPGAVIRYTFDCSDPTASSPIYNGTPLTISANKVLKARCFSSTGKLPGKTRSATYLFNVTHKLPVISVTTNNENLFGSTGIFDNYDQDWEKPCYIEYFDEKKEKKFEQAAGIQIDGGAGGSRSLPQHSFRLEPGNSALGDGDVDYRLIPDRFNRTSYSSFYLRNGSNSYLILPYKDAVQVKAMSKGTNNYYSAYTPIVAYINGVYWGVYELREKVNRDFFEKNYGAPSDSMDLLSMSYYAGLTLRALEGSVEPFWNDYNKFIGLNPADANYLNEVDKFLDLEYYTDYIIGESWMANTDWPNNNIKIFRSPITNNRWRFVILDLEWSFEPHAWSYYNTDHISYMLWQSDNIPYIRFWKELMKNPTYKNNFINRFADLMNTRYQYSVMSPMEEEMYALTYPEMAAHFLKWGEGKTVAQYMKEYTTNHNTLKNSFKQRTSNVRTHIRNNFGLTKQVNVQLLVEPALTGKIKINTIVPDSFPFNGVYFDGVPVTVSAIPNPGYKFVKWEKNSLITDVTKQTLTQNITLSSVTYKAIFEPDNTPFAAVTISEINYKSEPSVDSTDWLELWNYGTVSVNLKGWGLKDENPKHQFSFTGDVVLGANERLVVARDTALFKKAHPDVLNVTGPLGFPLQSNESNIIVTNDKDSVVASVHYLDSLPWPSGANGRGLTLELKNKFGDLNNANNWFNGCLGGSPGKEFEACDEPLVITEISYNAPANLLIGDYVELLNVSDKPVDISGWTLKDKNDTHAFSLPENVVVQPGERCVVGQSADRLKMVYPDLKNVYGAFTFGFSADGDWIRFYDKDSVLRISLRYDEKAPWPVMKTGEFFTIEQKNVDGDNHSGGNWFAGCELGSPGKAYNAAECLVVSVPEVAYEMMKIYPNPATSYVDFEMKLPATEQLYALKVYSMLGNELMTINLSGARGVVKKRIDLSAMPKGLLLLSVQGKTADKRVKILHQ